MKRSFMSTTMPSVRLLHLLFVHAFANLRGIPMFIAYLVDRTNTSLDIWLECGKLGEPFDTDRNITKKRKKKVRSCPENLEMS